MQISTLRPGLLISLKTAVQGNVSFAKKELEAPHVEEDGALVSMWETEKSVANPKEYETAIQIRSKARGLIVGLCSASSFGLLCPESKANELNDRIVEAQELAEAFNKESQLTKISVFVIIGRVAQDDVQAVRAINSEIVDLMNAMESGLQKLDVKTVRDAADKARGLGAMLSENASSRVTEAIKVARSAARKIVKAAETGAAEIDQATLTKIRASRTAFLDMDEAGEIAAPEATGRAIDLEETPAAVEVPGSIVTAFEIEDAEGEAMPITAAPARSFSLDLELNA